ncbi:hypothetical protein LT330_000068 [Penicillium expansum]|nr:hypothetical protein LT330_000068 [Penicillium expansum]KGO42959.1 hypothetical protein PEXP_027080 [Penicillium expansum]
MPALILSPYNDSMRLGQGYNSFLQTPCLEDSVTIQQAPGSQGTRPENQSQTVSYSTRCVDRISEVVRLMGVSAGSSIKSGSIDNSGAFTIDEVKFAESDLNVVVSVKVINQIQRHRGSATFMPNAKIGELTEAEFHEIYGDCFISGFLEGGELHGIVSIRVLDSSRRNAVIAELKSHLNTTSSAPGWSLGDTSKISSYMSETETNITVNWSGGGFIKPEQDEWDFDTLIRVASSFSHRVAQCPHKTWAILTRYDALDSFIEWARTPKIKIRKYDNIQRHVADLLDTHLEYKSNLARLNNALSNPERYIAATGENAIPVTIKSLVFERSRLKLEMDCIVKEIEDLDAAPEQVKMMELKPRVTAPEIWRARLPVLKKHEMETLSSIDNEVDYLRGLPSILGDNGEPENHPLVDHYQDLKERGKSSVTGTPAVKPAEKSVEQPIETGLSQQAPPPSLESASVTLCDPAILSHLNQNEVDFVTNAKNAELYKAFYFGRPVGNLYGGSFFNDAPDLLNAVGADEWPTRLEMDATSENFVHRIKLVYPKFTSSHAAEHSPFSAGGVANVRETLPANAKIVEIRFTERLTYVAVELSNGRKYACGTRPSNAAALITFSVPEGFKGLKGFWGREGHSLERIGPIWG